MEKYLHLQWKVDQWLVFAAIWRSKFHRQRKVDLIASEKLLVFVTIRPRKFHLYVQLSYTKILYLPKYTHLPKDAAVLHFYLKESSENMIFLWNWNIQKLTKIWSFMFFSKVFVRWKFFFSCSVPRSAVSSQENTCFSN